MLSKQLVDNRHCHCWTGASNMLQRGDYGLLIVFNRQETSELKHTNGKLNSNNYTQT